MNKYAQVAIKAIELVNKKELDIINAWKICAKEVFGDTPSALKGCPRNAFLGLCEEGMILGIEKGNYTTSLKNKTYALNAVEEIKMDESLVNNPRALWKKVVSSNKAHNQQMNVVCELYKRGLIKI